MNDSMTHTAMEFVLHGLKLAWQSFAKEMRDDWQQAYRDTHGVCTHPPAMRKRDDWNRTVECNLCGRRANDCESEADKLWETDEERRRPRQYICLPNGKMVFGGYVKE